MLQPAAGWRADYATRYDPAAVVRMSQQYESPGGDASDDPGGEIGAVPPRIVAMAQSGRHAAAASSV